MLNDGRVGISAVHPRGPPLWSPHQALRWAAAKKSQLGNLWRGEGPKGPKDYPKVTQ